MWKYVIFGILFGGLVFAVGFMYFTGQDLSQYLPSFAKQYVAPVSEEVVNLREKPLEKYTFERLREADISGGEIEIGEIYDEGEGYVSLLFSYPVDDLSDENKTYKASGLINIPLEDNNSLDNEEREYPVIVMNRGFVPSEMYSPGEGSRRSSQVLASEGFITLSPDFLGYGLSDQPSEDALEERFQTYVTSIALIKSLGSLNNALEEVVVNAENDEGDVSFGRWNNEDIGIWGHSNGGHISLAVLAIAGYDYPTVLWNPVSKHFPYSIFYYTDEYDDNGRALRRLIADFEREYDVELFSPPNYYKDIVAPIQIHQGLNDREILPWWSEELRDQLESRNNDKNEFVVEYFEYPNADHNLMPDGWDSAIQRTIDFYADEFLGE